MKKADALAPLFAVLQSLHVSEELRSRIYDTAEMIRVRPNATLLRAGETCTRVYFVVEGAFVCRYFNEHLESPKTINFYLPDLHPFMACVDSYFTQQPSACELRAVKSSVVLAMSKAHLEALLASNDNFQHFYHDLVIQALVEENELKLKIIAYNAEQLYQYLRAEFPAVIKSVPSKYIAEFMGISPEWLSKLKRKQK